MKIRHLWAVLVVICAVSSAWGQARTISAREARSLVHVILKHQHVRLSPRYCSLDQVYKDGKRFVEGSYSFSAMCDFPNAAATTPYGLFVVSERTADVWGMNGCEWFDFPQLSRLQLEIRRRLKTTEAERTRYKQSTGC
jgi:hypothetical protein